MFRKIGFRAESTPPAGETAAVPQPEPKLPVRCLVYVRFSGVNKAYAYYNDRFCLKEGDTVFVSGKLAGKPGTVESVQTHFKIHLSDYERILSKAEGDLRGHFEALMDKMVCVDPCVLPPEMFRTWVLPPEEDPEDVLLGEGFTADLNAFEQDDEMPQSALHKGLEMCKGGRVVYVHLQGSTGTAFLSGSVWREVNFTLKNGTVSDLYCSCPYPEDGMCKHMAAVLITLRFLTQCDKLQNTDSYVVLDRNWFWNTVSGTDQVDL